VLRLTPSGRLVGVDVARALALVGMAATHIFPGFEPDGDLHLSHAVASGRASALFAVLAGVGLALASGGARPLVGRELRAARAGVVARAGLLLVVGLLLGEVESPPLVILAYYALLFLVAVPFLGLGARPLAALAVGAAVVTPVASHVLRTPLDPATVEEPGGADLLRDLLLTGTYPVLTWTAYLFAGLAVGRLPLRRWTMALRVLAAGAALAVGARVASGLLLAAVGGSERLESSSEGISGSVDDALASGLFGTTPTGDWRWLTVAAPHSGTTFDLGHTTGSAMAVLGACLLAARLLPRLPLLPLAAVGSMTFTLYSLHVLALADDSPLLLDDRARLWWAHVLVALVVATAWRSTLGRGPLEALAAWLDRGARRLARGRRPAEPVVSRS
jgi:uncharacterized membrane protein